MSHAVVLVLTSRDGGDDGPDAPAGLIGEPATPGEPDVPLEERHEPLRGDRTAMAEPRAPLVRTVEQLLAHGRVTVLTWSRWVEPVREALTLGSAEAGSEAGSVAASAASVAGSEAGSVAASDADPAPATVVGVGSCEAALRWLAEPPEGPVAVLHGHLVADEVSLGRVADRAARGTAALVTAVDGPFGDEPGAPAGPPGDEAAGVEGSAAPVPGARRPQVPVRVARGRVTAAGSVYHHLEHPSHLAVGALRVAASDTPKLASAAAELADLLTDGPPPAWQQRLATVDTDLVALLLVALVRGGTPVSAITLPPGGVWRWCTDPSQLAAADRALTDVDVDRVRLDAAVKAEDGFFTTFLVSSYSRYWARWAARRGLTPDQVTSVSMLLGLAAAAGFALGSRPGLVAGAVLLQLAFTLDCVDGQLARYTRRFTARGAWLDAIFDRGKEYVVLAGLAAGGVRAGDDVVLWALAGAVLALQTFRHTLDLGYAEQQLADLDREVRRPLHEVDAGPPAFWEAVAAGPGEVADRPVRNLDPVAGGAAGGVGGDVWSDGGVGDPQRSTDRAGTPGASAGVATGARRAVRALRRAEAVAVLKWAKRIVVLPIGERFALISLLAIVGTPRLVLVVLLAWGALATVYTFTGRLIRSIA